MAKALASIKFEVGKKTGLFFVDFKNINSKKIFDYLTDGDTRFIFEKTYETKLFPNKFGSDPDSDGQLAIFHTSMEAPSIVSLIKWIKTFDWVNGENMQASALQVLRDGDRTAIAERLNLCLSLILV